MPAQFDSLQLNALVDACRGRIRYGAPMFATLVLTAVLTAVPSARTTTWIPLVKVGSEFGPTWKKSIEAAAEVQLKRRRRTKMMEPPAASVENTMVAMGCGEWNPACAHLIGSTLGAQRTLMVDVVAVDDKATIAFYLIGKNGNVMQTGGPYQLPDQLDEGRSRALKIIKNFIAGKYPTFLVVNPTPKGSTVTINDAPQKKKTPLKLDEKFDADVPITITIAHLGYVTWAEQVTLNAGASTVVAPVLTKEGNEVAVAATYSTTSSTTSETDSSVDSSGQPPSDVGEGSAPEESGPPSDATAEAPTTSGPGGGTETSDGGDFQPGAALLWTGVGTLGVAGVGAVAAAVPWVSSVAYGLVGCRPEFEPTVITMHCDTPVLDGFPKPLGEASHFVAWGGLPVAALLGAAGTGLLVSGIMLGDDLTEESPVPPVAARGPAAPRHASTLQPFAPTTGGVLGH